MKKMTPSDADAFKREIREEAKGGPGQPPIDLSLQRNWSNPRCSMVPDAQYHLGDAVILDVSQGEEKITVLESAEG